MIAKSEIISVPGVIEEPGVCPSRPQAQCEVPRSSRLIVKNGPDKGKNLLIWRWNAGNVTRDGIGDPTRTTKFALCMYDSLAGSQFRILYVAVDGGRSWRHGTPDVWQYSAFRDTHEGVTGIHLKTSASGKGKIRFKAEGSRFPVPRAATGTRLFHKDKDVVVQLINSSTSQCWTSKFAAAETNSTEAFAAVAKGGDTVIASRGSNDEPCVPDDSSGTVTR